MRKLASLPEATAWGRDTTRACVEGRGGPADSDPRLPKGRQVQSWRPCRFGLNPSWALHGQVPSPLQASQVPPLELGVVPMPQGGDEASKGERWLCKGPWSFPRQQHV